MINFVRKILLFSVLLINTTVLSESSSVSIILSSSDENVTVRSTVLLVCVAYGNPAPSINWHYNRGSDSSPIHNGSSIRHTVYNSLSYSSGLNFTESILEICGISIEEGGQYICNASNGIGVATNTTTLTIFERGDPRSPCNCSSVPVYSATGTLSFIQFNWTKVENPPVVYSGVNPNVTEYFVSVDGVGSHNVPVENVCPSLDVEDTTCSYSFSVPPSFNLPGGRIIGDVAARNEIGLGRKCSPSKNTIGAMNSYLTISLQTNNNNTVSVECLRGRESSLGQSTFECEFCYSSADSSCQSSTINWKCRFLDGLIVSLFTLTEGNYCYRATAVIDGNPSAVVQDTFNIPRPSQQPIYEDANVSTSILSISLSISAILAFGIGIVIGCLTCLCYIRGCINKTPHRVCLNCTHIDTNNIRASNTVCGDYETIPLPPTQQPKFIEGEAAAKLALSENEAYGKLPAPMSW